MTRSTLGLRVLPNRHAVRSGAQPVASFSGRILDITSSRALIVEDAALPDVVRIVDRATNTSQIIWSGGVSGKFRRSFEAS